MNTITESKTEVKKILCEPCQWGDNPKITEAVGVAETNEGNEYNCCEKCMHWFTKRDTPGTREYENRQLVDSWIPKKRVVVKSFTEIL